MGFPLEFLFPDDLWLLCARSGLLEAPSITAPAAAPFPFFHREQNVPDIPNPGERCPGNSRFVLPRDSTDFGLEYPGLGIINEQQNLGDIKGGIY